MIKSLLLTMLMFIGSVFSNKPSKDTGNNTEPLFSVIHDYDCTEEEGARLLDHSRVLASRGVKPDDAQLTTFLKEVREDDEV